MSKQHADQTETTTPEEATPPAKHAKPRPAAKIEAKFVKHTFTDAERLEFAQNLGAAIAAARNVESEFKSVKASFNLRTEEAKAKIDSLGDKLQAGFEMREKRCRVEYDAKNRRKRYFLEDAPEGAEPVADEPMTGADFQQDLILAESVFSQRDELPIFPATPDDSGLIVVGCLNGRWHTALRIKVGAKSINERLDSEQPSAKERADAIRKAAKRAKDWLVDNLGKEAFEGFKAKLQELVQANEEKVEGGAA